MSDNEIDLKSEVMSDEWFKQLIECLEHFNNTMEEMSRCMAEFKHYMENNSDKQ